MTTPETRYVSVTLRGETREVTIERLTPDHCWFIRSGDAVVARFPTGRKLHVIYAPQVVEYASGRWGIARQICHNRHVDAMAWAKEGDGSGWTGTLAAKTAAAGPEMNHPPTKEPNQ